MSIGLTGQVCWEKFSASCVKSLSDWSVTNIKYLLAFSCGNYVSSFAIVLSLIIYKFVFYDDYVTYYDFCARGVSLNNKAKKSSLWYKLLLWVSTLGVSFSLPWLSMFLNYLFLIYYSIHSHQFAIRMLTICRKFHTSTWK